MDFSAGDFVAAIESAEEQDEWISEHWSNNVADDGKKRAYFGQMRVMKSESFQKTTADFWAALNAWLEPVEQQIALRKSVEKDQKATAKTSMTKSKKR
jgi:hypothetical protein